ncbi:MAG: hypothetical protein LBQ86_05280 [Holophagales bacterium]|jgi:predicted RNase H-like nuclease (RuvC/YqgF family)|nr:hypothetical protein [Holophagales bacterium]
MPEKPVLLRLLPALTISCAISFAQAEDKPPRDIAQQNENIENYLKSLKEARMEQIKLRLSVLEDRAEAIAARWADLEAPLRRLHTETMTVWRQMQFVIQEASPEKEKSRKIKPLYDHYKSLRKELSEARQRLYQELPGMGDSPIQQARILFLMEEMERKERDGLRTRLQRRKREKNE